MERPMAWGEPGRGKRPGQPSPPALTGADIGGGGFDPAALDVVIPGDRAAIADGHTRVVPRYVRLLSPPLVLPHAYFVISDMRIGRQRIT
jgi:hypothetical protein